MLKELFSWIFRAWPALATILLGAIHLSVLRMLPAQSVLINKLTGTTMQVVGGLIVLCAVNQNLGLLRSQSLTSVVMSWFKDFPLTKKVGHVLIAGAGSIIFTGTGSVTAKSAANSIEERLAEAERQIEEIRNLVSAKVGELNSRIVTLKSELSSSIASNERTVLALTEKFDRATVGGFKEQSFGVLLAIYGAIVSIFT